MSTILFSLLFDPSLKEFTEIGVKTERENRKRKENAQSNSSKKQISLEIVASNQQTYRCNNCDSSMIMLLYASSALIFILAPLTLVVVVAPLFFASISPSCVELLLLSGCFWSFGEYLRHSFRFFFNFSCESKYIWRNSLMSINLSAQGGHNGSL